MPLRNQPYFPLYAQDFLSDEKVRECNAESIGVYILVMCVMHKSETYGKIVLKEKDKTGDIIKDFARKLSRQLPWDSELIARALDDLISENVLSIVGDTLIQKRMVKDADISEKRALSGKKGSESKVILDKEITLQNVAKPTTKKAEKTLTPLEQAKKGYEEMRKKIKAPMTERAWKLLEDKLEELAKTDDEKIYLLDTATAHCWKSVYKDNNYKPKVNTEETVNEEELALKQKELLELFGGGVS